MLSLSLDVPFADQPQSGVVTAAGVCLLKRALQHSPVDPQGRPIGRRRKRTSYESNERPNLLRRDEALEQRRRPYVLEEFLLNLLEGLVTGLGQRIDKFVDAT